MSAHTERRLARIRARFDERAHELAHVGFHLKGSLIERFTRCSSAGCACHQDPPKLHGPYWQWSTKIDGKTVTRRVREDQLSRYRAWMDKGQRVEELLRELQELSLEADRILRDREPESSS